MGHPAAVAAFVFSNRDFLMTGQQEVASRQQQEQRVDDEISRDEFERGEVEEKIRKLEEQQSSRAGPARKIREERDALEKVYQKAQNDVAMLHKDRDKSVLSVTESEREVAAVAERLEEQKAANCDDTQRLNDAQKFVEETKDKLAKQEQRLDVITACGEQQGGSGSLRLQLMRAKTRLSEVDAELHNIERQRQHSESERVALKKRAKQSGTELAQLSQSIEKQSQIVNSIQLELQAACFDPDVYKEKKSQLERLSDGRQRSEREAAAAMEEVGPSRVALRVPPHLQGRYFGQLFELVKLKEDFQACSTAIQVLVGGRLEFVIVDDKEASKELFQFNDLGRSRRRVTLLPLQDCKISKFCDHAMLQKNRKLVGCQEDDNSTVISCMDTIDYSSDFHKIAKYAFGQSLICQSSEAARKIAYQKDAHCRFSCATLQGDIYQPGGSMSGGSSNYLRQTLLLWQAYSAKKEIANRVHEQIAQLDAELRPMHGAAEFNAKTTHNLRLAQDKLEHLQARLASSRAEGERVALENLEAQDAELTARHETLVQEGDGLRRDVLRLDQEIYDLEHNREKCEQELKDSIKALKLQVKSAEVAYDKIQQELSSMQLELEKGRSQLANLRGEVGAKKESIRKIDLRLLEAGQVVDEREKILNVQKQKLEEAMKEQTEGAKEVHDLKANKNQLESIIAENKKLKKKLEIASTQLAAKIQSAKQEMTRLRSEHPWIASEEEKFGQAGSGYCVKELRPETVRQQLTELLAAQHGLSRRVNKKAVEQYKRTAAAYDDLINRKGKVEDDKRKIRDVIFDLDERKKRALLNTWSDVNTNFAAIFTHLLPNSSAQLQPVNKDDLMDGLEMKIAFGGKWKDSLAELSGGQRSLLALALVLALLKCKPAPVYILDEIDAALDLSHTQHIGNMIRTQFPNSQFIIVSLKEGMFSHADVLFKTNFHDGKSNVERHSLADRPQRGARGERRERAPRDEEEAEQEANKARRTNNMP
eukprot:GHVT01016730.1.p1 GENE.GHVT01016730.1~~GHVT01016730.1.p1  ORF type:complete len:991 (+),score=256.43 GHVT01016730.1:1326-4298(+)